MSNSLDSDQAGRSVRPDLGPSCLQNLSADNNSRPRANKFMCYTAISDMFTVYSLKCKFYFRHPQHCLC